MVRRRSTRPGGESEREGKKGDADNERDQPQPHVRSSRGHGVARGLLPDLTDGTRLLCVVRVDAEGAEVEDVRTEQLEWHPVRRLASATRAVTPLSVP